MAAAMCLLWGTAISAWVHKDRMISKMPDYRTRFCCLKKKKAWGADTEPEENANR